MKYLPFLSGIYSTAPGLASTTKATGRDALIFQIDESYKLYLNNKEDCRNENIFKYYCEERLNPETIRCVNQYLINQFIKEYPDQFEVNDHDLSFLNKLTGERFTWNKDWQTVNTSHYESLYDALCCQVQEDIAVFQLSNEEDWLAAIHLCSPNHWAPEEKIGKPFQAIHAPVPGMEKTLLHYRKMLESVVHAGSPFTRFAWGVATDTRLNHHPIPPPAIDAKDWKGREHDNTGTWYIRTERQNLIGLGSVNTFLFTIRTYFYSVNELSADEKKMLLIALQSMSAEALQYKGLSESIKLLEEFLAKQA